MFVFIYRKCGFVISCRLWKHWLQFYYLLASSRRSVGPGATQKTARETVKKVRWEEARELVWENWTKGRSGIPGSGIPSDWSILTDFVNTRALLTQMRYSIWRRSETFQRVTRCSNKQQAKRFLACENSRPSSLSSSDSDEWRSRHRLHDHGGLSSSRDHDYERPSWTVEHNRSRSNGNGYQLRSWEEPESARLCVKICKYGSWLPYNCRSVFGVY